METVELFDIEEDEVRGILDVIPVFWYRLKDLLEPSLVPILRKFGKRENLVFGVHLFTCGENRIIAILSEYISDLKAATFEIQGTFVSKWKGPKDDVRGEVRIAEIIEDILQEEFASPKQIFVCPECEAAYLIDTLKEVSEGKVLCQNCGKEIKVSANLLPPEM